MARIHRILGLLSLLGAGAFAQTTAVIGTITDPEGDLLQGSCSIQAVAPFTSSAGWRVVGTPMVVSFHGGSFAAALAPTDSASPSGQYYKVTCIVPLQTVGGRLVGPYSWGPRYWLVPTSATPLDISQIEVTSPPPQPSWTILPQQISGGTLTPGVNCFNVNSAGYISSLALCSTLLSPLFQPTITTGTTAQYFRGDLSLATFPTTWPWASITGVPSIANTVFGRSGAVTAQGGDYISDQVTEGSTNLYFTSARAQAAMAGLYQTPITTGTTAQYFRGDLSLATFPTTWAWNNLTGVPTLTNTVFGRSGTVTAQAGDYTSDQVNEGVSHLYFTSARAQSALAGLYQTPITTGTTAQYFRGDLSLATFPTTWAWANLTGVPSLVNSFIGRTGVVTAQAGDYTTSQVTEGTNLYFTNARAVAAMAGLYQTPITTGATAQYFRGDLSLATFPTTWAWANLTGVPTLTNTVFGRSGAVTAQSGDYTTTQVTEGTNLYFTAARVAAAMAGLYQTPITTGTTAQYIRGDLSLATFPTAWAWASLTGIPTLANTVFGRSGAVVAQSGDYTTTQVTEGTNLYFTNARVLSAMAGLYQTPISGAPGIWPTTWAWSALNGVPSSFNAGQILTVTIPALATGHLYYNGSTLAWDPATYLTGSVANTWTASQAFTAGFTSGSTGQLTGDASGDISTPGYFSASSVRLGGVGVFDFNGTTVRINAASNYWQGLTLYANGIAQLILTPTSATFANPVFGLAINNSWATFITQGTNNAFFGGGGGSATGTLNSAFGQAALQQVTSGGQNTAFGAQALYSITTTNSNTAVGYGALYRNQGYDNVGIGQAAGNYYTGTNWETGVSESIFIGMSTTALGNNDTNEIVIGYNAAGAGTNTAVIGPPATTDVYDGGAGGAANHHENGQFLTSRYSAAGTPIPACNATTLLEEVAVTDASSGTPGTTYASGGTWTVPVRCKYNSSGSSYVWVIE